MTEMFRDKVDINLTVNGEAVEAQVPVGQHAVDFLRHELGLTGAHARCEHGLTAMQCAGVLSLQRSLTAPRYGPSKVCRKPMQSAICKRRLLPATPCNAGSARRVCWYRRKSYYRRTGCLTGP